MRKLKLIHKKSIRSERIIGVLVVVAVVFGYAFFTTRSLRNGPLITSTTITEDEKIPSLVSLSGQTKHTVRLTLNDRLVPLSEAGGFSTSFLLHPGYTLLTLRGEDRFGKHVTKSVPLFSTTDAVSIRDIVDQRSLALNPPISQKIQLLDNNSANSSSSPEDEEVAQE